MNNIKVTVTYETPETSKFDALMAEYEVAKKIAEETVAYYKPLADVAEKAKFDTIMEQLETIKKYARCISEVKGGKAVWIEAHISEDKCAFGGDKFQVIYRPKQTDPWEFRTIYKMFCRGAISYFTQHLNLIGKWDEWDVYGRLEQNAINQLKQEINKQHAKAQAAINRLNNVIR